MTARPSPTSAHLTPSLPLVIVLLPLLLFGVGSWEVWRGQGTVAEHQALLDHAAQGDIQELAEELFTARMRMPLAWVTVMCGIVGTAAGLAGLGLVERAARRGTASRPALVSTFATVRRGLPAALGVLAVAIALGLVGSILFELGGLRFVQTVDTNDGKAVLAGILYMGVALWGAYKTVRNLRGTVALFTPIPAPLQARLVAEEEAPGLFALLRELACDQQAAMPDLVVASAAHGFFVTSFPWRLEPSGHTTRGRVLHLPLPIVATFSLGELRTVLGHELAHFSGEDTAYTEQFLPVAVALGRNVQATASTVDFGSSWVDRQLARSVMPHATLAAYARDRFDGVVKGWSRQREFEADRAGIEAGSPNALATSLIRDGLVGAQLRAELVRIAARPETAPPDLSAAMIVRSHEGLGDPTPHLGDHLSHPTDTHPTTRQRLEAVGITPDAALLAGAARPVAAGEFHAIRSLFADWVALSGDITALVRTAAESRAAAHQRRLRATADAIGSDAQVLYPSNGRVAAGIGLVATFSVFFTVAGVLALRDEVLDRPTAQLMVACVAGGLVGLGFAVLWSVRTFRGYRTPFLILDAEGFSSPGLDRLVPWLAVQSIDFGVGYSPTLTFTLHPQAALPRRTGAIKRVRPFAKQHTVVVGIMPRGMKAAACQALLTRHLDAAYAKATLGRGEPTIPAVADV
ncbi:M48 family metallopeptidase [Methylobacterium sp. J-092]|uniref:M48 family metallopeptidase n=1 Tax=Methylobacterium sp. J-092 TaxID=2836667 RepID=UPI001FB97EBE|nr:M48 family metallopeptidase [Methylobacterium sp. J-092]MCJ2009389.1 M48 family metallopeptidase [Methylobacterium sp. J-092]